MTLDPDYITTYADFFIKKIAEYSPEVISALIILFVGLYSIRIINRFIRKLMIKRNLDPTLSKFLADILLWVLRGLLFVTVIDKLGIGTTSFVTILATMGFAIGMSLQGSLSNFAGGILIILFKPFKVGDTIEAQGVLATVQEIQIFVTKLVTGNNQTIFVPNGSLSNGIITNYSMQGTRRADLTISISYGTDLKKAKDIITKVLAEDSKILTSPAVEVSVKNLTDNAIQLAVRPWAKTEDYGTVVANTLENCKLAFDEAGITFQPYITELSKSNNINN